MEIPSQVRFADEVLQRSFEQLSDGNSEEKEVREWLEQAFVNIEKNAFCGIQIPKRLILKEYLDKGIKNLWKYDLPRGWRLMYSIVNEEVIVVSIILEWFDHKEYERRFNY